MLINLSNHPSEFWGKDQKDAAAEYGEIIDIGFPVLDPSENEEYIKGKADEYLNKILSYGDSAVVHIMGEMTFVYALIYRLKQHGIKCIASTTQRIVTEQESGKKEVIFKFNRFREYI